MVSSPESIWIVVAAAGCTNLLAGGSFVNETVGLEDRPDVCVAEFFSSLMCPRGMIVMFCPRWKSRSKSFFRSLGPKMGSAGLKGPDVTPVIIGKSPPVWD